jgi:hypothetical protein
VGSLQVNLDGVVGAVVKTYRLESNRKNEHLKNTISHLFKYVYLHIAATHTLESSSTTTNLHEHAQLL